MTAMNPNKNTSINRLTFRQFRVLLGACIGLTTSFPTLFFSTIGVFLKPITIEFGWTRAQTSLATVMGNLGIAVGAVLIGRLIDRYGPKKMISISGIFLVIFLASLSLVPNNPVILMTISFLLGVFSIATTPLGYLAVLPKFFEKKLGLAFGCAMLGVGIGAIVMPIVAQIFIDLQGWRNSYISIAGVGLIGTCIALALIFVGDSDKESVSVTRLEKSEILVGKNLIESLSDWKFWLIMGVVFAVSASVLGFGVHAFSIITDRGINPILASSVIGIGASGVMLGRLLSGVLLDRFQVRYVGAASFILGGLGLAVFGFTDISSFSFLVIGAFFNSFAIGFEGDFMPYVVVRYFGRRSLASIYGCFFSCYAIGGVVGAIAYGAMFDRSGSYHQILMLAIALCLISGLMTLLLGEYRYKPEEN
jgi:MFS transporter, OFA family, oxalate/formate antiporter